MLEKIRILSRKKGRPKVFGNLLVRDKNPVVGNEKIYQLVVSIIYARNRFIFKIFQSDYGRDIVDQEEDEGRYT
ncbi:MAG: hypothetical protein H6Q52_2386 [Deltaproteobacteria bacterium]|nr:hypothetical protein [Deltaproteobacteria bacterium]